MRIRLSLCTACFFLTSIPLCADEPFSLVPAPTPAKAPASLRLADIEDHSLAGKTVIAVPAESTACDTTCPQGATRGKWIQCLAFRLRDSHWGYSEYFCERPFGSFLEAHMQTQIQHGLAQQMVLFRYDFVNQQGREGVELNPRGRQQLTKLAEVHQWTGLPLVIEQSLANPRLDAARRQAVLVALETMGAAIDPRMVQIGKPAAFGVSGEESSLIYPNQLQQTGDRGRSRIGTSLRSAGR